MSAVGLTPRFSIERAHNAQLRLSEHIVFEDTLPGKIRFVAGVDVAYAKGLSIGVVAVLDYDSLKLAESRVAVCRTGFPYIPTLLSFREIPPAIMSIKKLRTQPDVYLVDGQGFAHPYRCGFASHLGLVINKPTIGVAKSRLFGKAEDVESSKDVAFLKYNDEVVGATVTTKHGCKPIYVSVGHKVSLETSIKIAKHCTRDNRIPEPILRAHEIATQEKRKINNPLTTTSKQ
jgi:deoxyribonuclease V